MICLRGDTSDPWTVDELLACRLRSSGVLATRLDIEAVLGLLEDRGDVTSEPAPAGVPL